MTFELPKQRSLFEFNNKFDGETFEEKRDSLRLNAQLRRVRDLMLDGEWRTLAEIGGRLGIPEASASARLRDLRKERFGNYDVERRNLGGGSWVYRVKA